MSASHSFLICSIEYGVFLRRLPFGGLHTDFLGEFADGLDGDAALLVAEQHRAEHHFFRQHLGLGFHHQHGGFGAGHHQVELRGLERLVARVEQVLAAGVADARRTDRALERQAGDGQRRGGAEHGDDIRIDIRVHRHHGGDDLHFVGVTLGEQRTDGTIDQA